MFLSDIRNVHIAHSSNLECEQKVIQPFIYMQNIEQYPRFFQVCCPPLIQRTSDNKSITQLPQLREIRELKKHSTQYKLLHDIKKTYYSLQSQLLSCSLSCFYFCLINYVRFTRESHFMRKKITTKHLNFIIRSFVILFDVNEEIIKCYVLESEMFEGGCIEHCILSLYR